MTTATARLSWRARQARRARRHWPWLLSVAVLGAGLGLMAFDHWRKGIMVIGVAGLVAAVLRAVLPARRVSLLVVRNRPFDVLVLALLGATIVTLAVVIPIVHRR